MVLWTDQFVISASLHKTLSKVQRSMARDRSWQVRFDFAFEQVMCEYVAPDSDDDGTWISADMVVWSAANAPGKPARSWTRR